VRLLSPYMHMTNNRLGATLSDEAYLAYVLARALRDGDS
jgi:Lantibiotic biosynthesis dehydratase C-term